MPSNPDLFYFGGVEGGVWKSTDYGQNWTNITDGKLPGIASPIGAIAVADSNSNIIYAGTGESDIRGDFDTGDGVYKTTDAGKTWSYAGLRDTHMTSSLAIDPRNPNVVFAASMGHVFKPNPERGIFKTTDGGKTWKKVLFVDENTGGVDISMNKHNPNTLYAAMWQAQRTPWKLTSGGPGSGLYKTTDGGAHWTKISTNPGYATGILGKIGVSVSQKNPNVVYSIVQAKDGGVFRSDDAGKTWKHTNNQWKLRQRAFYYTAIFADPTDANRAYAPNVDAMYVTNDSGKVWKTIDGIPHGDNHIIWINPNHPNILLEGNDGGATVSVNQGKTWSTDLNQPTGQIYHVALDDQFPFHLYGASQDEGAWEFVSASNGGGPSLERLAFGRARREHVHRAGSRGSARDVRLRLLQFVREVKPRDRAREEREPVAALYGRRVVGGNEVSLRMDASDSVLAGQSERTARSVAGSFLQRRPRRKLERAQPRSDAQRSEYRRADRRTGL